MICKACQRYLIVAGRAQDECVTYPAELLHLQQISNIVHYIRAGVTILDHIYDLLVEQRKIRIVVVNQY